MCVWLIHSAVLLKPHGIVNQRYSKSPTYESESCKFSKMQTCFQMSNPITLVHMSGVHCTTVHTLHEVVLLRAFPDSSEYTVGYCLYFKPGCRETSIKAAGYGWNYCTCQRAVRQEQKCFLYFLCLLFMCYWCEKYYKPIIVQYYMANCIRWVPRLSLLDL